MTTDQFFAELERVHEQFEWTLTPDLSPGSERRAQPRLHLRATPRKETTSTTLDPIGAVCFARTGNAYHPSAPSAAEDLGMLPSTSGMLSAAAQDRSWTGPAGQRKPVPELEAMRTRLLETVGLSVTAT